MRPIRDRSLRANAAPRRTLYSQAMVGKRISAYPHELWITLCIPLAAHRQTP